MKIKHGRTLKNGLNHNNIMSTIQLDKLKITVGVSVIITILSCTFYLGTQFQRILQIKGSYDQVVIDMALIKPKVDTLMNWRKEVTAYYLPCKKQNQ